MPKVNDRAATVFVTCVRVDIVASILVARGRVCEGALMFQEVVVKRRESGELGVARKWVNKV